MASQQRSKQTRRAARGPRKRGKRPAAITDRGALARPLDTLVFLLPWILFYQLALILLRPTPAAATPDQIVAFGLLRYFFELFGTTAVIMPGLAVVVILLCTHVASGEPWRVNRKSIAWMYIESVLLAIPLVTLSHVVDRALRLISTEVVDARGWLTEVTLYIGAGIYEELIFRLVLIPVLVIIGADLLRLPHRPVTWTAVVLAAGLFAAHHYPPMGSDVFTWHSCAFRAMAGLYLGTVFVYRGYGPAAGLHIAYNLLVLLMSS